MTEINPFDVLDALGVHNCTEASRIHGGWDTTIWKVGVVDGTFALRLFHEGDDRRATLEAKTMRVASAAGITVPAIHADGVWQGRPALLFSWCPGQTLMQQMRARPWSIRKLGYQFGVQQARMHRVEFLPLEEGYASWMWQFGPVDDDVRERLLSIQPCRDRLLHLDYHPLNVMVSNGDISCVLDWANAAPGDPRADVARTWSILRLLPLSPNGPEHVTETARKLLAAGWLRGYQDEAGPLHDMPLFKVWAGTALIHDMLPRVDNPEFWIEQRHVDAIQRRVDELRQRAGLST